MSSPIVLASGSAIRQTLLANAGVPFTADPVRLDEDAIRDSLTAEGAPPRDVADALAAKGIEVPKRMILLKEPIKEVGTYQVPIRVYSDLEPEITVEVVPA